jgi:hypothetical protein
VIGERVGAAGAQPARAELPEWAGGGEFEGCGRGSFAVGLGVRNVPARASRAHRHRRLAATTRLVVLRFYYLYGVVNVKMHLNEAGL